MKRNKWEIAVEIGKILISCSAACLYFIKIFHEVGMLPGIDQFGETVIVQNDYYYSVYDKFFRENLLFLLWLSVAAIASSLVVSVCALAKGGSKKLKTASHILFGISALLFFINLATAASISYRY